MTLRPREAKVDIARADGTDASASIQALREKLETGRGRDYWRSLDDVADTPAFREFVEREFPVGASEFADSAGRRNFLKLMAASFALMGVTGCARQPAEKIVPYVRMPEQVVPGKTLPYATAMPVDGYAVGTLAQSYMGRPIKLEGHPGHPASLGGSSAIHQAALLDLYDPDRAKNIRERGAIRTWDQFSAALETAMEPIREASGYGLRILTGRTTSPTLAYQLETYLAAFSEARWHAYEPAANPEKERGIETVFGEPLAAHYHLEHADVILALDADFLNSGPASIRYARDYAGRRLTGSGADATMNRLYAVSAAPTVTSANADERLNVRPSEMEAFARALATKLGVPGGAGPGVRSEAQAWLDAVAQDLEANRGRCVVIPGEEQPAAVHALAHAINHRLGCVGRTVTYTERIERQPIGPEHSIEQLVEDLNEGRVDLLVILGVNPVYDAPADLDFLSAMQKASLRVHLSSRRDETAEWCHWHVPEAHFLESWSDARAHDGAVSIIQPLIAPLYNAWTAHEVVEAVFGNKEAAAYQLVRDYWTAQHGEDGFEAYWTLALSEGLVEGTALPARAVSVQADAVAALPISEPLTEGIEAAFRADPSVGDGRYANNGWLQELPKPLTKLTWDNALLISPALAERLGLRNREDVVVGAEGRTVNAPVWILPGHPDGTVTLHLGYGRIRAGRVGNDAGFNAYTLRTSAALWHARVEIGKGTGRLYPLAVTEDHHTLDRLETATEEAHARHVLRAGTLETYRAHPDFAQHMGHAPDPETTLYARQYGAEHQWGMVIDLNKCIGCNACMTACQAENNIPVVGKEQVAAGREMHWIRVDRYYSGGLDKPAVHHQPVPCMQCENAPCEVVCPVAATVHSEEGLNDMVYNRCIGTRYCSNNCPYKVRRFNFLRYIDDSPSLRAMRNPNVTVRGRGVMEKCTYCVQRINKARIQARLEDRRIEDGEVVTACQAACPAQAIVFGDLNDPGSRVSKLKTNSRNYGLLEDLNTRPRTTYLAKLTNPSPYLNTGQANGSHSEHE